MKNGLPSVSRLTERVSAAGASSTSNASIRWATYGLGQALERQLFGEPVTSEVDHDASQGITASDLHIAIVRQHHERD